MAGSIVHLSPNPPYLVTPYYPANLNSEAATGNPQRPRMIYTGGAGATNHANCKLLAIAGGADTLLVRHSWSGSGITCSTAPVIVVYQRMPYQESAVPGAEALYPSDVFPASMPNMKPGVLSPPAGGEFHVCTEYDTDNPAPSLNSLMVSDDSDGSLVMNTGKAHRIRLWPSGGEVFIAVSTAAVYSGASDGIIEAAASRTIAK